MNKIQQHIISSKEFKKIIQLLSNIKIKGGKVSLYRVLLIFFAKVKHDDVLERAYGVAFNLTLSVFPAIIFFFTLLPYLPFVDHLQIMSFLKDVMPPSIYKLTDTTIHDILSRPRSGLLSLGFLLALYLATSGMISLMHAFNQIFRTRESRSFIKTRGIAALLTLILAFVLVLAVLLLVIGQIAVEWLYHENSLLEAYVFYLIIVLRFMIMLMFFLLATSSIFYFAPAIHDRWNFISPGSVLAALLCLAASFLFSAYIANFGTYNKLYGSIGALIALMVWIYMISVILLLGYTLNSSLDIALDRFSDKKLVHPVPYDFQKVEAAHPENK